MRASALFALPLYVALFGPATADDAAPQICSSSAIEPGSAFPDAAKLRQACDLARYSCKDKNGASADEATLAGCMEDDVARHFPGAAQQAADFVAQQKAQADERLAQQRAVCTPGQAVRFRSTTYIGNVGSPGSFSGYVYGGQLAQAVGLDAAGEACTITFQRGRYLATGIVPLVAIATADQPGLAQQQQRYSSPVRQCRRRGWISFCFNVRN